MTLKSIQWFTKEYIRIYNFLNLNVTNASQKELRTQNVASSTVWKLLMIFCNKNHELKSWANMAYF
jgi:hypothetical protein